MFFFPDQLFKKKPVLPVRREQDRPAPRRRRACQADVRYFVTDPSNPQRLRSARAVLEAWFNRAFHARFSAPIAPGPVLYSLPGTSPAALDHRQA
jgi:hypothetical protein